MIHTSSNVYHLGEWWVEKRKRQWIKCQSSVWLLKARHRVVKQLASYAQENVYLLHTIDERHKHNRHAIISFVSFVFFACVRLFPRAPFSFICAFVMKCHGFYHRVPPDRCDVVHSVWNWIHSQWISFDERMLLVNCCTAFVLRASHFVLFFKGGNCMYWEKAEE